MKYGNHSFTHPHVNNLGLQENMQEIRKCSLLIESITGNKTKLYRGPYGEYNNTVIQAAKQEDHETIQWNIDTLDYTGLDTNQMWSRIEKNLDKGSIILMHNGTKYTASSLETIIKNIKEKGYEIVPISELIYKENYTIDNNGTQKQI